MITKQLTIGNRRGLHARASAKFVQLAGRFDADIWVERDGQKVVGTSIMGLLLLAAGLGECITVTAQGEEAEQAMRAIEDLINRKFDEEPEETVE